MKRIPHILTAVLLILALGACTKGGIIGGEEPQEQTQSAAGTLTFDFGGVQTYAVTTYPMEKRICSVAIFIETEDGALHKYLYCNDTKELLNTGFEKIEQENTYLISGTIELPALAITNLAVIGNYFHRDVNITAELLALDSWADLTAFRVPAAARGVFLNLGHLAYKIFTPAEIAALATTDKTNVVLRRTCACIRINPVLELKADDGTTTLVQNWEALQDRYANGDPYGNAVLRFESLVVYNPKSASYLLPDLRSTAEITAIPQYERFNAIPYTGMQNDYYFYEMTGDEAQPLLLYVIFKYRPNKDEPYEYGFSGIEVTCPTAGNRCLLERNHVYEIDLPFTVPYAAADILEWDEGGWLHAQP